MYELVFLLEEFVNGETDASLLIEFHKRARASRTHHQRKPQGLYYETWANGENLIFATLPLASDPRKKIIKIKTD